MDLLWSWRRQGEHDDSADDEGHDGGEANSDPTWSATGGKGFFQAQARHAQSTQEGQNKLIYPLGAGLLTITSMSYEPHATEIASTGWKI